MKRVLILLSVLFSCVRVTAQVQKQHVVEHFTNTSCSICASNNSKIYTAVASASYVNHISFHPSSPYTTDFFNQQNKQENDDRTKFYGVYGSTPRLAFDGNTQVNYSTIASAIQAVDGKEFSNYKILATAIQQGGQSIVKVTIEKVAGDTLRKALLFVGLAEDTVFHTSNNGEKTHINVFRKALSAVNGDMLVLPVNIGDTIQRSFSLAFATSWDVSRISALAILQREDKMLINSAYSAQFNSILTSVTNTSMRENINVFPNPSSGWIKLNLSENTRVEVIDLYGRVLLNKILPAGAALDLNDLKQGTYFIHLPEKENAKVLLIRD